MSWFDYGTPKRRHLRKGVWLRLIHLPAPLLKQIKKHSKKEELFYVEVSKIRPKGKVLLEIWCHQPGPRMHPTIPARYTVFHLLVDEDPTWCCEGDLGRGYKE
jgi:hypothetical protein